MKENNKKHPQILKGNLTEITQNENPPPLYENYSVTRHDLPSDETNIPAPDAENVIQSKKFVDENER